MAGEDRIRYLADAIRYHRELYYNHSAPEISDSEFDALWDELTRLDPSNEVLHEDLYQGASHTPSLYSFLVFF